MAKLPGRPRTMRGVVVALGSSVVLVAVVLALVYFLLFPTSS
jgi:hypothetical protein